MAQAMAQQALRQRHMAEANQIQQQARSGRMRENELRDTLGSLFGGLDPQAEGFGGQRSQLVGQIAPHFVDNPDALAQMVRLSSNLSGADLGQLGQTFMDPGDIMALDQSQFDRQQQASRSQQMAEQFGPAAAALLGGGGDFGDLPNFLQQTGAISALQGVPIQQALAHTTGQLENVAPAGTGDIFQVNALTSQATPVVSAADPDRMAQGLPPVGRVAGQQPQAPTQPQAPQAQPVPGMAQAPQDQQPLAPQGDVQLPAGVEMSPERTAANQGIPTAEQRTPAGVVERLYRPDGEPLTAFDLVEFSAGPGAGVQRMLTGTLGQVSESFTFLAPDIARAQLAQLAADIRPLMTVSNRPSRWELEQIQQALADPGVTANPATNATRLARLHQDIKAGAEEARQRLATPGAMSNEERRNLRAALAHSETLLDKIGEPRQVSASGTTIERLREVGQAFIGGRQEASQFGQQAREALSPEQPAQEGDELDELTPEEIEFLLGGG